MAGSGKGSSGFGSVHGRHSRASGRANPEPRLAGTAVGGRGVGHELLRRLGACAAGQRAAGRGQPERQKDPCACIPGPCRCCTCVCWTHRSAAVIVSFVVLCSGHARGISSGLRKWKSDRRREERRVPPARLNALGTLEFPIVTIPRLACGELATSLRIPADIRVISTRAHGLTAGKLCPAFEEPNRRR
jgi:hypothetical protein